MTTTLSGVPWLLVVTGLALLAGVLPELRRPAARRLALGLALTTVATFALHRAISEPSFFHQNGHGPMRVGQALCDTSTLGAGFTEVFGAVAGLDPQHAETLVFRAQGALAALAPAAAYLTASAVGAGPALAAGLALVTATEPVLVRMAWTESYYATCTSLLFVAAAVLAGWPRRGARSDARAVLAAACAGLIVAQAARTHPLCWPAAAMLPLVTAVRPGDTRTRLRQTLMTAAVIAVAVVATSGGEMLHVLQSGQGQSWVAHVSLFDTIGSRISPGRVLLVVVLGYWLRSEALAVTGLLATVVVARLTDLHAGSPPWVHAAYYRQFAPVAIAAVATLLAHWPGRRLWPGRLAVAAGLAVSAARFPSLQVQATDEREQTAMRAWRELIPPDATLVWVARAGQRVLTLPIYGDCSDFPSGGVAAGEPLRPLASFGPKVYYYRSSLCSSADGRARCEALEADANLVPVAHASIAARESMGGMGFDRDPVEVALFRFEPPAPPP